MKKYDAVKRRAGICSFSVISENRAILLGLATLMILIFHSAIDLDIYSQKYLGLTGFSFTAVKHRLDAGVDIFLMLSGLGLFYTLHKDPSLRHFYKKRAMRILPTLFLVVTFWDLYTTPRLSIPGYLRSLVFEEFWAHGIRTFWYFSLLIPLYIVYPLIHKIYDRFRLKGFLSLLLASFALLPIMKLAAPEIYLRLEIALYRIPAFLIGGWIGKLSMEGKSFSGIWVWISGAVLVLLCILYGLESSMFGISFRILECLQALCTLIFFSFLCSRVRLIGVKRFLIWLGTYSMETYLLTERVYEIFGQRFTFSEGAGMLKSLCFFLITMVLSILLKLVTDALNRELFHAKLPEEAEKSPDAKEACASSSVISQ